MKAALFLQISLLMAATAPVGAETLALEKRVIEHTCPNGIKLLVLERHFRRRWRSA